MNREEFCLKVFEDDDELNWFISLCWNMAIFTSNGNDHAHASFFWYCVFLFSTLSIPSYEILETQRQALTLTVTTFLLHSSTANTPTATPFPTEELTLSKCIGLLSTCREVILKMTQMNSIPTSGTNSVNVASEVGVNESTPGSPAILEETYQSLQLLEITCLVRMNSPMLLPKLKEICTSRAPSTMHTFFLNLYHLLEEEKCTDLTAKKECLRSAFQVLLQQPTYALEQVGEVIYHLLQVCESKSEEFHWVEQLLQITKTRGEPAK